MPLPRSYQEYLPNLPARRSVETVWTYVAADNGNHLVLPDGRMDIILRYRLEAGDQCRDIRPLIAGPTDRPSIIPVTSGTGFVGLRLLPGRAGCLGQPAHLTSRQTFREAAALKLLPELQQLPLKTENPGILAEALQDWMLKTLAPPPEPVLDLLDRAMDHLHLTGGRDEVSLVADAAGISVRRLHRLFLRWVGLAPKTFAEILQFHRALRLLGNGLSLAAAAYEAGYADQPHMARRFARMGGFSPARRPEVTLAGLPLIGAKENDGEASIFKNICGRGHSFNAPA